MRCLLAVSLLAAVGAIDFSNVLISIQDKPYNALNRLVEAYFAPELSLWLPRGSTIALFDDVNAQPASLYVVIDMILSDHMLRCQDSDGMCRFPCASQSMATHVEGGAFSLVSRAFSPPSPVQLSDPYPINHNTSSDTLFISGVSVSGVRSAMASFFRALSSSSVPSCRVHAPPPWLHMRGHQFSTWAFAFSPWPSAAVKYINELATFGTNMVGTTSLTIFP